MTVPPHQPFKRGVFAPLDVHAQQLPVGFGLG
jgi:hypothetical protein